MSAILRVKSGAVWIDVPAIRGQDGQNGAAGASGANGADGARGPAGQSAYQAAQAGGYTDTEANFYADLAATQSLASGLAALL